MRLPRYGLRKRPIPPPAKAWPLPNQDEVLLREHKLGRCPSCATREHLCTEADCTCPLLRCGDRRLLEV